MDHVIDVTGALVGVTVIASSIAMPLLQQNVISRSEIRKIADGMMALDFPITVEQRRFAAEMVDCFLSSIQADDPPDTPAKVKPDWFKNIIEGGKDGAKG